MIEATFDAKAFHAGMVAVAGNTVLAHQFLVKWGAGERLFERQAGAGQAADLGRLVTADAAFVGDPA